MKLYCVRHGEAMSAEVDPERGLTDQGKDEVAAVAQQLLSHEIHVSHIMHSPKLRAVQTAEIFAAYLEVDQVSECVSLLDEDADVQTLVEMIQSWESGTMLVGHLPFMSKLVSALVVKDENNFPIVNFPPAALVCLEFYDHQRWIINWLLRPGIVGVVHDDH